MPPGASPTTSDPPTPPADPVVTTAPPRGVPHYGAIVATAVSQGGTAALSRDQLGEVRVWPTLDGTVAAQAVPVRSVLAMRIADGGDELLAGFAETTGGGHLLRFDRRGTLLGAAVIRGPGTVLHVAPLGDASGALVLFADHSLALVGRDGAVRATLAQRGLRLRAIETVGARAAVVLLRRSEGDGEAVHAVARVEASGDTLTLTQERALPLVPLEPTRFAVSPDGKRVAFSRDPDDDKATVKKKGARRERRADKPAPPKPPKPARIAVVELATGKDVTPAELRAQAFNDVVTLGFSSANQLHVFEASNQTDVDLGSGVVIAGNLARIGPASVGEDTLVSAYDVSLLVQVPQGAVRYLGWQANVPQRVALSRDGSRAAWASARGELIVEALDGSEEIYGGLFDAPVTLLEFLGDDHVLLGSGRGTLHLVDAHSGKEVGSMAPPGPLNRVDVDTEAGWVAGLRPGGGVWLVKIDPAQPMPTTTYAVADGAVQFGLLARPGTGAPLLVTVDGKQVARRYTEAELVAGVSAASIRERPSVTLPRAMNRFDRAGKGYAIEGRKLIIYDGTAVASTIPLGFDIHDVGFDAGVAHLIVLGPATPIAEIGSDGKTRWTASMGPGGRWAWAFSADGSRLAVVGSGGGLVIDATTGERVAASCAWRFGSTSAPPLSRSVGVAPVCR
jgi:hypothetical protein